jgi:endoglucanase
MKLSSLCRIVAAPAALAAVVTTVLVAQPATAASPAPGDRLYVNPASTAGAAAANLTGQARADALQIAGQSSGTWITSGSAQEAAKTAGQVVSAAAEDGSVPLLVLYNIPFRDCAQYSAGGATNTADYEAWIDAIASAIGNKRAIIALEPDSLGIIPFNTDINGNKEWCQPADANPATAVSDRYEQLTHAVKSLKANPNAKVYLDGTNAAWLSVGDITDRLRKADVADADGFFVNASNYESQFKTTEYSRWISQCLDLSARVSWWQPAWCASQYYPATVSDPSTWTQTDQKYAADYANAGISPDPSVMKKSIVDTSRNGQGAWTPPANNGWPDAQTWCNPPDRGLGVLPTLSTGDPLIDGFLWIKVPGESDGQCDRGTGSQVDPARGIADPAAGAWFATQARELIANAAQPLPAPTCSVENIVHGSWPGGFNAQITVTNTGTQPISGWSLRWAFPGEQTVTSDNWSATFHQNGPVVTNGNLSWNTVIKPGKKVTFGYIGAGTAPTKPIALNLLNGKACAS